jgi:AAA+ ATPase superfamily predicted ATPase
MKKAADWIAIDERLIPLAGRRSEAQELVALRTRQSRLITGPPGMGKTRLLAEAVSGCAVPYLLIRGPRVLHDLLLQLAGMLACRMTGATSISFSLPSSNR